MRLHGCFQALEIVILDMPPILSKMQRYAIGAGLFGHQGSFDRIRIIGAACLPHGGDMIDVDTKMLFDTSVQSLLLPVHQLPGAFP